MRKEKEFENNLLSWYPFQENSTILAIKKELEIHASILPLSANMTTVDITKKGEDIKKFITSLEPSKKWDYITLLGSLKDAIACFKGEEELFFVLRNSLKENGKILIATDNKFGISHWIGKENTVTGSTSYSKNELDNLFQRYHITYVKYYYPLPNYKIANVIYTDKILPNEESISRNLSLYQEQEIINGEPTSIYREIIKNNAKDFPYFSNSFFIELGWNEKIEDNEIQFISFANLRKEKYRIQTVIQKDKVYKKAITQESNQHIDTIKQNIERLKEIGIHTLDSYDDKQIISQYTMEQSLDRLILQLLKEKKEEEAFSLIHRFRETLLTIPKGDNENTIFEKYQIDIEKEKKNKLHFLRDGLWDLTFQNCFLINNEFYFYDQEWYDENVPLEYILYRAIIYLPNLARYISQEEWLKKLNIMDFKDEFQLLDNKIQNEIREENIWKYHTDTLKVTDLEEKYKQEIKINKERETHIQLIENDNVKKQEYILSLEKKQEELKTQLEYEKKVIEDILNSTSWKVTEPIRKITKVFKNKERKDIK